jgi:hypothetical protein
VRSLQEIQLDFEEEAKAYAGLWSQEKKRRSCKTDSDNTVRLILFLCLSTMKWWHMGSEGKY